MENKSRRAKLEAVARAVAEFDKYWPPKGTSGDLKNHVSVEGEETDPFTRELLKDLPEKKKRPY